MAEGSSSVGPRTAGISRTRSERRRRDAAFLVAAVPTPGPTARRTFRFATAVASSYLGTEEWLEEFLRRSRPCRG